MWHVLSSDFPKTCTKVIKFRQKRTIKGLKTLNNLKIVKKIIKQLTFLEKKHYFCGWIFTISDYMMGKFAESLKKYFEETPQEMLDKEWEDIKPLNDIGPDVMEYGERVRMYYGLTMQNVQHIPTTHFSQDNFKIGNKYYLAA